MELTVCIVFPQDPVPIPAWDGIYDSTVDGPVCPQLHIATDKVIGNEDCLTVNLYTTDVRNLLFSRSIHSNGNRRRPISTIFINSASVHSTTRIQRISLYKDRILCYTLLVIIKCLKVGIYERKVLLLLQQHSFILHS